MQHPLAKKPLIAWQNILETLERMQPSSELPNTTEPLNRFEEVIGHLL
jgi:hypothetical protein